MSGLFAYALAGGLAGAGEGISEKAKREWEEAMEKADFQRQRQLAEEDRAFQGEQAGLDRDFRAGESAADRAARLQAAGMSAGATRYSADLRARLAAEGREHDVRMAQVAAEIRATEQAAERAYQEGRDEDARTHETRLVELRQDFTAGENAADRGANAALQTQRIEAAHEQGHGTAIDANGGLVLRRGDQAVPITGPDGEQIVPPTDDSSVYTRVFSTTFDTLMQDRVLSNMTTADAIAAADKAAKMAVGGEPAGGTGLMPGGASGGGLPEGFPMKNGVPAPTSKEQFDMLPSGTEFVDPTGRLREKP